MPERGQFQNIGRTQRHGKRHAPRNKGWSILKPGTEFSQTGPQVAFCRARQRAAYNARGPDVI
jgi:hypothetical protein